MTDERMTPAESADGQSGAMIGAPERTAPIHAAGERLEPGLQALVAAHLADPGSSWSIGAFGAIAEFHQTRDEQSVVRAGENAHESVAITARGALRLRLTPACRVQAYELLSARPALWLHGVALCLPHANARMGARSVITELGADRDAIRPDDADDIVFDLGLSLANVDFCVRSGDAALTAALRAASGNSLLASPALFERLTRDSPHRVMMSALGRVEVYGPIGADNAAANDHSAGNAAPIDDRAGSTARGQGPHTHLLPKLLRLKRTHAANVPIPAGWLPCVSCYPENPILDKGGVAKSFDLRQYVAFQALLEAHGDRCHVETKRATMAAVRDGQDPRTWGAPQSRVARNAVRLALRQLRQLDGESQHLARWLSQRDGAVAGPMSADRH